MEVEMPEPRTQLFPEQLHLNVPAGTIAAVRAMARGEGQTNSEFVRAAIRVQLRRADTNQAAAAATGDGRWRPPSTRPTKPT